MTMEIKAENEFQKAPWNGFRIITNHTRYWFTFLNVLAVISFLVMPVLDEILPQVKYKQTVISLTGYFVYLNPIVLMLNVAYFTLTRASQVFIVQPTFFTGKTSKDGTTKEYSFKLEPYSIDKWRFAAWIQKVEIKPLSLLEVYSVKKEDGSDISYTTFQRKGEKLISVQINREIRKGFFLLFTLKPEKDLDDTEDIDSFERSLSIVISIFYKKSIVKFEQIKEIPS